LLVEMREAGVDESLVQEAGSRIAAVYGVEREVEDGATFVEQLLLREDAVQRALFPALLEVAAIGIPAVAHNVGLPDEPDVDWQWLREQVLAARRRGVTYPGIGIRGDGAIGVMALGKYLRDLRAVHPDREVYVLVDHLHWSFVEIVSWSDLASGDFFRKRMASSSA
jgi:hypothetical protein